MSAKPPREVWVTVDQDGASVVACTSREAAEVWAREDGDTVHRYVLADAEREVVGYVVRRGERYLGEHDGWYLWRGNARIWETPEPARLRATADEARVVRVVRRRRK